MLGRVPIFLYVGGEVAFVSDLHFSGISTLRKADRAQIIGRGDARQAQRRDEGHVHVAALLAEGNAGYYG